VEWKGKYEENDSDGRDFGGICSGWQRLCGNRVGCVGWVRRPWVRRKCGCGIRWGSLRCSSACGGGSTPGCSGRSASVRGLCSASRRGACVSCRGGSRRAALCALLPTGVLRSLSLLPPALPLSLSSTEQGKVSEPRSSLEGRGFSSASGLGQPQHHRRGECPCPFKRWKVSAPTAERGRSGSGRGKCSRSSSLNSRWQ
jgi:hypothetical protein